MDRIKNQMFGENISIFFWFEHGRERGKKIKKSKSSFGDPRSSVGQNLSSQVLKSISSTRAKHTYQEQGISLKIQRRRFGDLGKSKLLGLRSVLEAFYPLKEVGFFLLWFYLYFLG